MLNFSLLCAQDGASDATNYAFSLGFKVEVHAPSGHTHQHLQEMASLLKRHDLTGRCAGASLDHRCAHTLNRSTHSLLTRTVETSQVSSLPLTRGYSTRIRNPLKCSSWSFRRRRYLCGLVQRSLQSPVAKLIPSRSTSLLADTLIASATTVR